jgi:hypothetical protein
MSDLSMRKATRPRETVVTRLTVAWVAWVASHVDSMATERGGERDREQGGDPVPHPW